MCGATLRIPPKCRLLAEPANRVASNKTLRAWLGANGPLLRADPHRFRVAEYPYSFGGQLSTVS